MADRPGMIPTVSMAMLVVEVGPGTASREIPGFPVHTHARVTRAWGPGTGITLRIPHGTGSHDAFTQAMGRGVRTAVQVMGRMRAEARGVCPIMEVDHVSRVPIPVRTDDCEVLAIVRPRAESPIMEVSRIHVADIDDFDLADWTLFSVHDRDLAVMHMEKLDFMLHDAVPGWCP